jgi:hypothetical protein
MDRKKSINYQTSEDFVMDREFLSWVLHSDPELNMFWKSYRKENPEKEAMILDAILIIKSLQPYSQEVPQDRLDEILQEVHKSDRKLRFHWNAGLKYAASIGIFLAISSLVYLSVLTKNQFPVEVAMKPAEKGKVILANGTVKEFETDQTTIQQTESGKLAINSDTITVVTSQTASALNQIVIPYGKRSEITLADGTHIWLNSGSQLSYPSKFKTESREVYLSGEAFFEVSAEPHKPFHVITHDIRIRVIGTKFNVSSYAEDNTVQTVLLKGKVTAGKNSPFAGTIELAPGERLTLDKTNSNLSKDKVDVQLYSSWVNGYLVFKNEPITQVYAKLKRFYNQNILVEEGLGQITFSGKLDLGGNIKDVLDNIAFASSVHVLEDNGSFLIKR